MSAKMYSYESYYDKFRVGFELSWNDLKAKTQRDILQYCADQYRAKDIAFKQVHAMVVCFREEDNEDHPGGI